MPTKPRLKQGETPQSESFKARMKEYSRQVALEEATKAKEEQDAREADERAGRDVLKESKTGPVKAQPEESKPEESKPEESAGSVQAKGGRALRDRTKNIDSMVSALESGIDEANEDDKAKRKK